MIEQLILLDKKIFIWINQYRNDFFSDFLMPIISERRVWWPFYILLAFYFIYKFRKRGIIYLISGLLLVTVADKTGNYFKDFFHRTRPCLNPELKSFILPYQVPFFEKEKTFHCTSDNYSFPSNHALNHFAMAIFLIFIFKQKKWLIFLLLIWAFMISYSRIYLGMHYPADVLFGAMIGTFWSVVFVVGMNKVMKLFGY